MVLWREVMQATFLPLAVLACWAAWVEVTRVVIPALRGGQVMRLALGFGGGIVAVGLGMECAIYWVVRWVDSMEWLGKVYWLVAIPKALYIVGFVYQVSCTVPEDRRLHRARQLAMLAAALFVAGLVVSTND